MKHCAKNVVLDCTTDFTGSRYPRPKGDSHFSEPSLADGFHVAILPWVARSNRLLSFDRDLLRDRLPRAIQIYPLQGLDLRRILNGFQKLINNVIVPTILFCTITIPARSTG